MEDIVNIRKECLTFLHSWETELGRGSDKSTENCLAVHGICHEPHQSSLTKMLYYSEDKTVYSSNLTISMVTQDDFRVPFECLVDGGYSREYGVKVYLIEKGTFKMHVLSDHKTILVYD